MAGGCCGGCGTAPPPKDTAWRRVLWIALAVNLGMFVVEVTAGVSARSAALRADALDFLGDAANYAISLGVAGLALRWRARAARLKGASLLALGLWVLGSTAWIAVSGALPAPETMGAVGVLALLANLSCALLLWRHRGREPQLGLDMLAERRHRQCRGGRGGARRVRHRHRLAGPSGRGDARRAGGQRRLADRRQGTAGIDGRAAPPRDSGRFPSAADSIAKPIGNRCIRSAARAAWFNRSGPGIRAPRWSDVTRI